MIFGSVPAAVVKDNSLSIRRMSVGDGVGGGDNNHGKDKSIPPKSSGTEEQPKVLNLKN